VRFCCRIRQLAKQLDSNKNPTYLGRMNEEQIESISKSLRRIADSLDSIIGQPDERVNKLALRIWTEGFVGIENTVPVKLNQPVAVVLEQDQ